MKIAVILGIESVSHLRLYGISSEERLRRQLREAGYKKIILGREIGSISSEEIDDLFITDARLVVDDRLFKFLQSFASGSVVLEAPYPFALLRKADIPGYWASLQAGEARLPVSATTISKENVDSYIADLRLKVEPYAIVLTPDSNIAAIENTMYEANFKGTLDFIATYVYKYPVREITRYVSRAPWLTPNLFTALSIFCSFAFPWFFSQGQIGLAITLGWIMFIADSVDGKLARLTVRLSRVAGMIEHGTSAPAIWLWFVGMGWFFVGKEWNDISGPYMAATLLLAGLYWLDKGVNGLFKGHFGRDMYDYTPLDKRFHLIACRRAVILFIITCGYVSNQLSASFLFLAGWMVFSFLFHIYRLIWIRTRA